MSTAPTQATAARRAGRATAPAGTPLRPLYLPFDWLRSLRARAVRAGWLANSILASRDFERVVHALEHRALGRYARSV